MDLHEKTAQRKLAQAIAPRVSQAILLLGITEFLRKVIAVLNYFIGRGAGTGQNLDSEVTVALRTIARNGPVVFDVGANVGEWSQKYRDLMPEGRLYMFEPQIACQESIVARAIPNSELVKAAVGSEKGKLTLHSSSPTDGTASLHQRKDSFFRDRDYTSVEVEVLRLDEFMKERNIEFVDYIKFDIEGHEYQALAGLKDSLAEGRIGAFSFEFGSGNLNSRSCFRDFWELLSPKFDISIITPSGKLYRLREYYEDMEFYRGVSNFVAQLKR